MYAEHWETIGHFLFYITTLFRKKEQPRGEIISESKTLWHVNLQVRFRSLSLSVRDNIRGNNSGRPPSVTIICYNTLMKWTSVTSNWKYIYWQMGSLNRYYIRWRYLWWQSINTNVFIASLFLFWPCVQSLLFFPPLDNDNRTSSHAYHPISPLLLVILFHSFFCV
jgi:hypothetical protein